MNTIAGIMASHFIGYNVLVTLKAPPNQTLQGQVANVIGQRLILQNGMCVCVCYRGSWKLVWLTEMNEQLCFRGMVNSYRRTRLMRPI